MTLDNTKPRKAEKIKKPLTGVQAVAAILGVRTDSVSRVITGQTLCTPTRVQFYIDELARVDQVLNEYVDRRQKEISNNTIN